MGLALMSSPAFTSVFVYDLIDTYWNEELLNKFKNNQIATYIDHISILC